jgi:uncharacterized protein (TIGR03067 family)
MFARVVPLCVVFLLFAAFTSAQDAKKELEALQGDWTSESREVKGKKIDIQFNLTIKGNQWLVSPDNSDPKITFKIDPSKNPKTIDIMQGEETVTLGIYKLEGDRMTMCRSFGKGSARPTEFKSEEAILIVWKREKK